MSNPVDPKLIRLLPTTAETPPAPRQYQNHGEMLFHEHLAGRLSVTDLRVMTAIHAADRTVMFFPLPYPDFPPVLREYAIARINGVRPARDPDMNRQVGRWLDAVQKISHQNLADIQFFRWISDYLERAGMVDRFLAVQAKIVEYEKNKPVDEDLATQVHTLDWKTKQWEGR